MAVSINTSGTYKTTRIDTANSGTGWNVVKIEGSGGTPSLLASVGTVDLVAEGTDAVAVRTNKTRILLNFSYATGYDFTSGSTGSGGTAVPDGIVYIWAAFLAAGSALTKTNGGLQIALGDGTNTSYWNVAGSDTYSGGFVKWAVYTGQDPSENSGANANLGDIIDIGFVTDVGGTTTRFDNFVVDAMDTGLGLTIQGTTVGDALFAESLTQDEVTAIGILSEKEGIIFSQGSLEFSGTAQTSDGETLVFSDTVGGAYTYKLDITGTIVFTNTAIDAAGLVDYDFDTSGATDFTMNGGSLTNFNTLVTAASQDMDGIVFQGGGTSTIANVIINSTFNLCGLITVTGELTDNTINNGTASASVKTDDLAKVTGNTFKSDGSNHAVELSALGSGTMTWDNTLSGYVSGGSGGSPVTPTSTGNEAIYVNFTSSSDLTINVAAGATTPSIRVGAGFTGDVNVVAGLKTFSFTVAPSITGYEWRIYSVTAVGSLDGSTELDGEENATADNQSYAYSYTVDTPIAVQIISQPDEDFEEEVQYFTLGNADQDVEITLTLDNNN